MILRAIFGLDRGERLERLRVLVGEMTKFAMSPISLIPPLQRFGRLFPAVGDFLEVRGQADEEIQALIDERRADPGDRDDVLSMLLLARHEDGSPMSDVELRDELMTLLVAGHETTATELSWAFERLLRNRGARRLTADVDSGEDAYLTATIRETLRRRPVLSIAGPRRVVAEIEVDGRTYGPGCHLVPNAYLVHHDPEIYPEPYAFRPERFLEEDPGTYTWIPFGGGRRRCRRQLRDARDGDRPPAVLSRMEVRIGGAGRLEANRRRMITVVPGKGAEAILSERERAPVPA